MAQIIAHPRAAQAVVIQKNGPGRPPKKVISIYSLKANRERNERQPQEIKDLLERLQWRIGVYEDAILKARWEIAATKQASVRAMS